MTGEIRTRPDSEYVLDAGIQQPLDAKYKQVKNIENADGSFTQIVALDPSQDQNVAVPGGLGIADGANLDAFSRLRTSEPNYVFDSQFEYDLQPLLFEKVTAQSGATVTHDATNRNALFTFSNTPTGGKAFLQTYEHFRYQAGRSQLVLATFNFMGGVANTLKFIGYSNGVNGVELQMNGTTARIALYSGTAKGNEFVNQADWNLDAMDGNGPSGLLVDWTKTHILVIDFQWLGVGRMRVGLDIDGLVYYVHQFDHANHQEVAYMQTANLPLRAGMTCTDTASTTMRFICCSVTTEGGETDIGGYQFSDTVSTNAGNNVRAHGVSIQPLPTFNGIVNRTKIILESVDIVVTGNYPVILELVLGQALAGSNTFTPVNATYSAVGENTAGTLSGDPGIIIGSMFCAASASTKQATSKNISNRYPLGLNAGATPRDLGRVTALVTGIGGASACRISLNWREIR